jgi:hypothetical protein
MEDSINEIRMSPNDKTAGLQLLVDFKTKSTALTNINAQVVHGHLQTLNTAQKWEDFHKAALLRLYPYLAQPPVPQGTGTQAAGRGCCNWGNNTNTQQNVSGTSNSTQAGQDGLIQQCCEGLKGCLGIIFPCLT